MREALLVIGHGSRDAQGVAEFLELGRMLTARRPQRPMAGAFLEFARPTIDEAIDKLAAGSAETIVCVPGMLFAAGHVKNDVPSEIQAAMRRWPHIEFRMARALDVHPKLLELCRMRWIAALRGMAAVPLRDTALLVVGRGSSDPDANSDVAKLTRLLAEGYGVGWSSACYSGVTTPLVPDALDIVSRSGFRRVVVQPYFLFTGVLVKKIQSWAREHALRHPELEIICTEHLGVHPLLADVFEERAHEAMHGSPAMNCQLCKYRVQMIGHETSQGLPQVGHHHHVRGIGGEPDALQVEGHHHLHTPEHAHPHGDADPNRQRARDELVATPEPHLWDERLVQFLAF